MTSTLLLKSASALTAPLSGTPKIPDIDTALIWSLDTSSLVLAEGATVTSWIATGTTTLINRTYNFAFTGWGFPIYSAAGGPNGHAAVMFNGSQQLCNGAGTAAVVQPITYAFVTKSTAFASTQSRTLASGSQIVGPGNSGYYASGGTRLESGVNSTDWQVIVVVFDGANSKIKVGNGAILTGATGAALVASARNCLGGQGSTLTGVGLVGGIAHGRAYNRALNDSDINGLYLTLSRNFGI